MKLKTALITTFVLFFFSFFFLNISGAQVFVPMDTDDVIVSANITTDLYTQLSLEPATVEIRQPANVNITALTSSGTARPSRNIIIYIQGNSAGIVITQPPLTNAFGSTTGNVSSTIPGTYTVCAKDITEGYDILIIDCETLYVIPVVAPVMLPEPQYTKGNSNIVMWNMSGSGIYQYYVEVSKDGSFLSVDNNSGWISNLAYEFNNLQNTTMYFYRVKARNTFGGESSWSNIVFSVQDSSGPAIDLISISGVGENNTSQWDGNFTVNMKYRIKDNVGISSKEFWCVGDNDSKYECTYTSSVSGDFWNISLKLKDLATDENGYLFNSYTFCVEAIDFVSNVTRNCTAKLDVPDKEIDDDTPPTEPPVIPEKPKPPSPPIVNVIKEIAKDLIDNTIGKLEPIDLQNITVTTTSANITIGLGFLLTALGNIPYFILQVILAILSLLGFRKKGNVTGYVYNSLTKEPIMQAIVRIFNESNELVWTDVTDSHGYFRSTDLEDAEYYIKVTARDYSFPSKIVFGKTDFPFENVYHGDPFLTMDKKIPNFSIPMDQQEVGIFRKVIAKFISRTKSLWKSLHILLFLFGLIFSIYALYTTNLIWNYVVVVLYIPALIALIFSLFNKKEKYGIVKDEENNYIEGAIVALNEKEFGKLVSKRVTDSLGRYRFIVNKGVYDISIMNSDLKLINKDKLLGLEIEKDGGSILSPDIIVKKLEDSTKGEKVEEPLKEL